jgi:hypothetical protein
LVELQIRSILQHAWAAVGHDHVYKGVVRFSKEEERRFFAIAGGLELFDREFNSVRGKRSDAYSRWSSAYSKGERLDEEMDIAGVEAMSDIESGLKVVSPGSGVSVPKDLEASVLECLAEVGVRTGLVLRNIMRSRVFQSRLRMYAAAKGIGASDVSFFPRAIIAASLKKPAVLKGRFDELLSDPSLKLIVELGRRAT